MKLRYTLVLIISIICNAINSHAVTTDNIADLIPKLLPAVVNISSVQKVSSRYGSNSLPLFPHGSPFEEFNEFFERFGMIPGWDGEEDRSTTSLGSGFIIDPKGYVVTNHHVVQDAEEVSVILNGDKQYKATIIGHDPKTDLALLKIDAKEDLPFVKFGDSNAARVGEWVVAIGNPFGLGGTVTTGIISARGRDIHAGKYDDFIQTDAAINKGNSGGPMFNLKGEVIGINAAIYSPSGGNIGIGFAIPSSMAKPIIEQLKQTGKVTRGWLGVVIQPLTKEIADSLNLPNTKGAIVVEVDPKGSAYKAGIKPRDVITKFNGKEITTNRSLPRLVAEAPIHSKAKVELIRAGKTRIVEILIEESPETARQPDTKYSKEKSTDAKSYLGIELAELDSNIRSQLRLDSKSQGVVITKTYRKSKASESGLMRGDVIVEIDDEKITKIADVNKMIAKAVNAKKTSILMVIIRKNQRLFVGVKLQ